VNVRVLYFGAVRELLGQSEERLALPEDVVTVRHFADYLSLVHAPLVGRLEYVRFARNEAFASLEESIVDGDVLALVPPVSGG
jgi:molybdopterin converting factor subunit 1